MRTELGTLVTTPDHPFAKVDAGWTPAADLAVGDRVHIRGSAEGTKVLELDVREVSPTPVYNLTVERTHTYFVGSQDVLVHNINCFGRPRRQPDQPPEPQPPKRRSLAELLAEEREQERAARWALPRNEGKFLDTPSDGDGPCTACTMASLGDFDTLSRFLDAHADKRDSSGRQIVSEGLNGLTNQDLIDVMKLIGLRSDTTPKPETFPKPGTPVDGRSRRERFKHWGDVEKFIQTSTANTFAVTIEYWSEDGQQEGHALVGVRKDDGTIAFLDFSFEPPVILDLKKLNISHVGLIPTDVDWHDNRHVNDLFKNTPKLRPPSKGWRPRRPRWLPFR